jgi:glucose/arabinose dehydrogenase
MRHLAVRLAAAFALASSAHAVARGATVPTGFQDELVVGGLSLPTGIAFLPDGRLLFVEQISCRVRLVVNGALSSSDPVCTLPNVRTSGSNRGVYGIAVDPRWPASPYVYIQYPLTNGRLALSRYTVTGDLAFTGGGALSIATSSRYELYSNLFDAAHNGGTLRFGADGLLYASVGDSIAVPCSAQDTTRMRGSILRLEVRHLPAGAGGPPTLASLTPPDNPFVTSPVAAMRLVWARGLRNPFRFHIDPFDGSLFIADVGESQWEEIDRSTGRENFGWPLFEGPAAFSTCAGVPQAGMHPPIHAYPHTDGFAVIGMGVYRRPASGARRFPAEYDGDYFFADHLTGFVRRIEGAGNLWAPAPPAQGQPSPQDWGSGFDTITDCLQAPDGSLWYCRQSVDYVADTGQIRRLSFGVTTDAPMPGRLARLDVSPSPSHGRVRVRATVHEAGSCEVRVLNVHGRQVRGLAAGVVPAGDREWLWDGRDDTGRTAPAGVYWISVRGPSFAASGRAVLLP